MKLKDIMTRDVEVVQPDESLQSAARKMKQRDIGFLPVCENDRLVGTLTDRDITVEAVADGRDPKKTQVKDLVHSDVIWCYEDQDVTEGAQLMEDKQVRRLMVVRRDDKKLVGVVSLGDLATHTKPKLFGEVLDKVSE